MRAVLSNADLVRIGRGVKRDNPLVFPRRARVDAAMLPGNGLSAIHGGLPLGDRGTEAGVSAMAGGGAPLAATGESLGPFALAGPLSTHERPRVARLGNKPLAGIGAAEERPILQQPTRPEPPGWPAPPQMGGTAATSMGSSAKQRPGAQLTGVYIAATAPLELEPYAATVVKGRKREEWAKALQREIGRLSQLSAGISEEIGRIEESNDYRQELRNPGLFRQYPERSPRERIQSLLAQIRGKDDDYRRNHGRPLPGTLNAQVEEIRRTLTAVTKADQARAAVKEVGRAPATSPTPAVTRPAPPGKIDALNLFPIAPPKLEQKAAVKVGEFIPASGVAQHERLSGAIRQAIAAGAIPAPPDLAPEGAPERKLQEQRLAKLRQVVEAYNTKLRQEHSFDVGGYRWGGPDEAAYVLNTTPWLELNARHGKRWNWQEFGSFAKAQGLGQLSDFDKKVLNAAINARRMEWLDKAVGKLRSEGEQVMEGALFVAGELFGMGATPIVLRDLGIVGKGLSRSAAGQGVQKLVTNAANSRPGQTILAAANSPAGKPVVRAGKSMANVAKPSKAKVQNALANSWQEGASAALEPDPEMDAIISRTIAGAAVGYGGTGGFELLGQLARGTLQLSAEGAKVVRARLRAVKARSDYERGKIIEASLQEGRGGGLLISKPAEAQAMPRRKRSLSQILLGEKPERLQATEKELQELHDHVRRVAGSQKFRSRARKLGFTDEHLKQLDHRIEGMIKEDRIGWAKIGGWLDDTELLIGRAYKSQRAVDPRIRHELMHLLDDVADPGLIQRSVKPDFPWKGYFDAERKAWEAQLGRGASVPLNLWLAGLTASANRRGLLGAGTWIGGSAAPFLGASTYLAPRLFRDEPDDEVKAPERR